MHDAHSAFMHNSVFRCFIHGSIKKKKKKKRKKRSYNLFSLRNCHKFAFRHGKILYFCLYNGKLVRARIFNLVHVINPRIYENDSLTFLPSRKHAYINLTP